MEWDIIWRSLLIFYSLVLVITGFWCWIDYQSFRETNKWVEITFVVCTIIFGFFIVVGILSAIIPGIHGLMLHGIPL